MMVCCLDYFLGDSSNYQITKMYVSSLPSFLGKQLIILTEVGPVGQDFGFQI